MRVMKPIVANIVDFETLRKHGQRHADKTAYLHRLVSGPRRVFSP